MKILRSVLPALVCLLIMQLVFADGTDVEFIVKKRCHDYNLRTTTDTLKAIYKPYSIEFNNKRTGDTAALPEGVYKFAFTQCSFNRIDSVSVEVGKVYFTDSVLTFDLRKYLTDTTQTSITFYIKGQLVYFKTFVLLPSVRKPTPSPCNCDTGNTVFYIRNMLLNNSGILSKQSISQLVTDSSINKFLAWAAVKQNNNENCYETLACSVTYKYTDNTGTHSIKNQKLTPTNGMRIWHDLFKNVPTYTNVKIVYRYHRSRLCSDGIIRDGRFPIYKPFYRSVKREKLQLTLMP